VGQRRGLGIATGEPLYVITTDPAAQRVTVGPEPELYRASLVASGVNWIAVAGLAGETRVEVKIRNKHAAAPATLTPADGGRVMVGFDRPQRAVTPGQAAVFYQGDLVVGGGWID
jgi:tRNA-specific 2-thiouridylase